MKTFYAAIASLVIGFGAAYAVINHTTVKEQAETISTMNTQIVKLNNEIKELNNEIELKTIENQELNAKNKRLSEDRNAGVLFGIQLCKQMKDERSCLLELGVRTRSPMDFK
ncbi:hypothetical protein AHT88_17780 [Salmonella enterica subsp. enterica serovar Muenchen]|nr:hypothetical protein [Salmonella enterica subsp. enterica serovar Muenchen]